MRFRQTFGNQQTAWRGVETLEDRIAVLIGLRDPGGDLGVQGHRANFQCLMHFGHIGQQHTFARLAFAIHCKIIDAENHIL